MRRLAILAALLLVLGGGALYWGTLLVIDGPFLEGVLNAPVLTRRIEWDAALRRHPRWTGMGLWGLALLLVLAV